MLLHRLTLVLLPVLVIYTGCSGYAPLRPEQVVTRDAYQSGDETIQRVPDSFTPISAVELAAGRDQPVRFPRGWVLIDDGTTMREPAPGFSGSRAELALELSQRLAATLTPLPARAGRPATIPVSLEIERASTLGDDLSTALTQLENRWPVGTKTTLLIFSRADRVTESAVATARRMQSQHGEGVCLNLITVGDKTACYKLRAFNTCGSAVRGERIAAPETMAAYAIRVFYDDPTDSDGDGIPDYRDQCPDTPRGLRVNWDGCPFDEAALRSLLPDQKMKGY
ncbi:MAG: hypothetical protein P9F75_01565 [Candidatus Contendobacter sp.]|nr:hypothetical protein [Candidatus Contendobacter sp.]